MTGPVPRRRRFALMFALSAILVFGAGVVLFAPFGGVGLDLQPLGHREEFGREVAFFGDVDGDGTSDFLVAQPGGREHPGTVFAISGRRGKVLYRVRGSQPGDGFGNTIAPVGDLDGDGVPDFAVGAPFAGAGPWIELAAPYAGEARLFSGADGRLLRVLSGADLAGPDATRNGRAGSALSAAGDVDGDGSPDIAIGLPELDGGRGLAVVVSWRDGRIVRRIPREPGEREMGYALAGGVDFDRDGVPDLVVGVPGARQRRVFGDGQVRIVSGSDGRKLAAFDGGAAKSRDGEQVGLRVSLLPDLDGDGTPDVLSAGGYDGGRLVGISGRTGELLTEWKPPPERDYFEHSVAPLPDLDGDRLPELVYAWFVGTKYEGAHASCDFGPSEVVALSSGAGRVLWSYEGTTGSSTCNLAVAAGGDVDGDGYPDVLVGERGEPCGTVTVLSGKSGASIYRVDAPGP